MKKTRTTIIVGILIGLIIATAIGVYATNTFNSKDISYANERTIVDNVKDAVDELYKSINITSSGVFSVSLTEKGIPLSNEKQQIG